MGAVRFALRMCCACARRVCSWLARLVACLVLQPVRSLHPTAFYVHNSILLLSSFLKLSLLSLFPFLSLMLVCYTHIFHVHEHVLYYNCRVLHSRLLEVTVRITVLMVQHVQQCYKCMSSNHVLYKHSTCTLAHTSTYICTCELYNVHLYRYNVHVCT